MTRASSVEQHMRLRQREMGAQKPPIKAVAFDLDDTTWWQRRIWEKDLKGVLAEDYQLKLSNRDLAKFDGGRIISEIVDKFNLQVDPAEIIKKVNASHLESTSGGMRLTPGTISALRSLQAHGFALGAATSGWEHIVLPRLEETGIAAYISPENVVARDHVQKFKPDPEPILMVAERLGVEPRELLFVGNERTDVVAAKRAGAWSALVTNGQFAGKKAWRADIMVARLYDLPRKLSQIGVMHD